MVKIVGWVLNFEQWLFTWVLCESTWLTAGRGPYDQSQCILTSNLSWTTYLLGWTFNLTSEPGEVPSNQFISIKYNLDFRIHPEFVHGSVGSIRPGHRVMCIYRVHNHSGSSTRPIYIISENQTVLKRQQKLARFWSPVLLRPLDIESNNLSPPVSKIQSQSFFSFFLSCENLYVRFILVFLKPFFFPYLSVLGFWLHLLRSIQLLFVVCCVGFLDNWW